MYVCLFVYLYVCMYVSISQFPHRIYTLDLWLLYIVVDIYLWMRPPWHRPSLRAVIVHVDKAPDDIRWGWLRAGMGCPSKHQWPWWGYLWLIFGVIVYLIIYIWCIDHLYMVCLMFGVQYCSMGLIWEYEREWNMMTIMERSWEDRGNVIGIYLTAHGIMAVSGSSWG